jgi:hypothetical protein
VPSPGAYAFAAIVALCRTEAGQIQACTDRSAQAPASAVGYLTYMSAPSPSMYRPVGEMQYGGYGACCQEPHAEVPTLRWRD